MFVSQETINNVNELIKRFFQHNRSWDNFLGFCNVEWALSNFNSVFHKGLAHLYPLLADVCSDMLLDFNIVPKYGTTEADYRTYENLEDFFLANILEHKETYDLICKASKQAEANGDLNIAKELDRLLRMFNKFMAQALLLKDKADVYGDNLWAFDAYAQQFYILEDIKEELTND
jgi:hypothetical protein